MRRKDMTKNFYFRFHECNLTIEQTAKLCFKSERVVTSWDKGKEIPKECKRLMRMAKGRELHQSKEWEGFEMVGDRLKLPTGYYATPQQIIIGLGLLELDPHFEESYSSRIIRIARAIANILVIKRAL